ncbi:flavin-containing monooxygenase 5-like [Haliotis asinina]|uniref:flavin-containing monooxygenase 5-like n=1 Tax=Haliotis asinina TaxID=109174 RepID=UPI0035325EE0
MKNIAIIGAGCSGLAAVKACLDENLVPVCFERGSDIGGLWNFSETSTHDHASIYKNLVINTSKEMMSFSDFPTPADFPPFMPHEYVLKYFRLYAEKFHLLEHVRFNTTVRNIGKWCDYDATGRWGVTVSVEGSPPFTRVFDGVMVCTGHHSVPYTPTLKGADTFKGPVMHSHGYKESSNFKGKRVLIIGIGNSAADIAVDLSRAASKVFLSTRRGAWIIGKTSIKGIPADLLANSRFVFSLPLNLLQWVVEKQANFKIDHDTFGLSPQHGALEAHPTINDELPYQLVNGKVSIKPNVRTFAQNGAEFADDTFEEIDAVIYATGYDYRLAIVDEDVLRIDNNRTHLYQYMIPTNLTHPTFSVIGLVQPIGAIMPISEMQCRWFTKLIKGEVCLPSKEEMLNSVGQKFALMNQTYIKSRRHTVQTYWIDYMDEIASKIGVKPNFKRLVFEDPVLAFKCFFGPCVPAQYRLTGPGKWEGARPLIMDAVSRATRGATCRKTCAKKRQSRMERSSTLMLLLYVFVFFTLVTMWCFDSFIDFSVIDMLSLLQKEHVEHALAG